MTNCGVQILADVLCGIDNNFLCTSLEKLHISFNRAITDESLEIFLELMEKNQTLKILYVQNCSLSEKVRRCLRKATLKKKNRKFNLSD